MTSNENRFTEPNSPKQFNVENLFRRPFKLVIPEWQREYSWSGELEVNLLLQDLRHFYRNPSRPHYLLGSIITFPKNSNRVVVDGQQRTVTLYLLLCAIHSNLSHLVNIEFAEETIPEHIHTVIETLKRCIRHTTSQSAYPPIEMVYGGGTEMLTQVYSEVLEEFDAPTQTQERIAEVYNYIKSDLQREFGSSRELTEFTVAVLQGVFLTEISVEDQRQALEVFIKLNSRGKDLEDSDLIKNYLFQRVDSAHFEHVSNLWSTMNKNLRRYPVKEKLRNAAFFLRNWALYEKGTRLDGDFPVWEYWEKKLEEDAQRDTFLASVDRKSKDFSNIVNSNFPRREVENEALQSSKYLGSTQHFPLLLAGAHLEEDRFSYLSKLINARTVIYVLSLERTQDFESMVPTWAKQISRLSSNCTVDEINNTVFESNNAQLSRADEKNFASYLSTLTYSKQKKKVKVVLATLAKEFQRRVSQDDLTMEQFLEGYNPARARGYDIDHIFPQSKFPDTENEMYDGLGNLVPISGRQRIYKDKDPIEKVPLYREGPIIARALIPLDTSTDSKHLKVLEDIQKGFYEDLGKWGAESINQRLQFLVKEFIATLPAPLFESRKQDIT